ncbi:response regulator, partial [Escherichia coli]|nr:response regulator [Escherichia coli]
YKVSEAESGAEMREVLQGGDVDLIMLDINLPGEDGLMLTRELRSQSDIGIILVTGRTDSIDKIVGLEMGADDYVTKPFELRELLV